MKIGMMTASDDNNNEAFLGIEGRLKGTTIAPRIITIQSFPHPLLPALLINNNGVPCTLQYGQAIPDSRIPHHLDGGTWICCVPGSYDAPMIQQQHFILIPQPSYHIFPYGQDTRTTTSPPPFLTLGNPMVRSISPSDIIIAVDPSSTLTPLLSFILVAKSPSLCYTMITHLDEYCSNLADNAIPLPPTLSTPRHAL